MVSIGYLFPEGTSRKIRFVPFFFINATSSRFTANLLDIIRIRVRASAGLWNLAGGFGLSSFGVSYGCDGRCWPASGVSVRSVRSPSTAGFRHRRAERKIVTVLDGCQIVAAISEDEGFSDMIPAEGGGRDSVEPVVKSESPRQTDRRTEQLGTAKIRLKTHYRNN